MEEMRKNKNRGYQKLRVWEDAVSFYVSSCRVFGKFPYGLSRIASQAMASSDSVHRNIAEGYCRRSIREYLNFLNFALGLWVNLYRDCMPIWQPGRSVTPILKSWMRCRTNLKTVY